MFKTKRFSAFGNEPNWILESLSKSIVKFKNTPLDIRIVSRGNSNPTIQKLARIYQF